WSTGENIRFEVRHRYGLLKLKYYNKDKQKYCINFKNETTTTRQANSYSGKDQSEIDQEKSKLLEIGPIKTKSNSTYCFQRVDHRKQNNVIETEHYPKPKFTDNQNQLKCEWIKTHQKEFEDLNKCCKEDEIITSIIDLFLICIFGVHLMFAICNNNFQESSTRFLNLLARESCRQSHVKNLSLLLKLSNYGHAYHTENKYGFTYGKLQLISMREFLMIEFNKGYHRSLKVKGQKIVTPNSEEKLNFELPSYI
ncbi:hypothetical protein DERF_012395, partial [Dermatophagoides farinae]